MITDFKGKTAVITGGAHGIGYAFAQECLGKGMNVVITASRQSSVDKAVATLEGGDRLIGVQSDAGDAEANAKLAKLVKDKFGQPSLLVLNAGISRMAPIHDLTPEKWRQTLSVNLDGVAYGTLAFLPLMEQQTEAHIVINASIFGFFSAGLQAPYFASKAGAVAFAETLYYDLLAAGSPVGVSLLCPGNTRTNILETALTGEEPEEFRQLIEAEMAAGTSPAFVAQATLDAVRDNTFYVTPNTGDFIYPIEARFDRILKGRNPAPEDVGDTV
ncbi:SDR family NAD(P)-dependent oxidoreductase [Tropicibacter sp. R16_0]|uniref:SDR family NAD(P)-dependent oxidoreductase n=1 Tax=Tropicibacter sp. R16_0 TaxID=2821102 RepID=UPI001AD9AA02|nr:SDR family NAD(P)-dependent oxidoreductase [Tropicibacter sp. R16_0]MBO9453414.1 SDR family NAD(P)-dependent oxidoreductase [Tropicibacter sp. R16_0]